MRFLDKWKLSQFLIGAKEKLLGRYCLYNNKRWWTWKNPSDYTVSTFPFTLSRSCLGFKKLEIEALTNDNRRICYTIFDPRDNFSFNLSNVYLAGDGSGSSWIYIKTIGCKIANNGTTIVEEGYSGERQKGAAADACTFTHNYLIEIVKVIGYTHY